MDEGTKKVFNPFFKLFLKSFFGIFQKQNEINAKNVKNTIDGPRALW